MEYRSCSTPGAARDSVRPSSGYSWQDHGRDPPKRVIPPADSFDPRWRIGSSRDHRAHITGCHPRSRMAAKRVADLLVDTLVGAGVQRIYGVAGDSLNGITDSIRPRKDIAWAHVRHEEAAAFAAGAEAQLTGRLAVCAGSCGPGNLHLINGLFDAHRSRAPVLAIAAQNLAPRSEEATSRKRIPTSSFGSAATMRSWSPSPNRCRVSLRSRCGPRSPGRASRSWPFPGISRFDRRRPVRLA